MEKPPFRISAVVLASGLSRRMGKAKQLLEIGGLPMLEVVIRKTLPFPFANIYGIVGHRHQDIAGRIAIPDSRFQWHYNARYQEGQSAALQCAAAAAQADDGMVVFLGDQPAIQWSTIRLVWEEALTKLGAAAGEKIVIRPSYLGQPGHPVFFSNACFPSFASIQGDEGGKRIVAEADQRWTLPVDDSGILRDVDTPKDYERLLESGE